MQWLDHFHHFAILSKRLDTPETPENSGNVLWKSLLNRTPETVGYTLWNSKKIRIPSMKTAPNPHPKIALKQNTTGPDFEPHVAPMAK